MSSFKKALVWSLDDTLLSFKEPFPLWQRPARFGTPGFQTSSSSSRVFGFQHVSTHSRTTLRQLGSHAVLFTHFVPTGHDFLSDFIQNSSRIQRTSTSSGHFRALEASSGIQDLTWMLSSVVPTAAFQKVGGSPNRRFGWWKWMIAYPSNTWTMN